MDQNKDERARQRVINRLIRALHRGDREMITRMIDKLNRLGVPEHIKDLIEELEKNLNSSINARDPSENEAKPGSSKN